VIVCYFYSIHKYRPQHLTKSSRLAGILFRLIIFDQEVKVQQLGRCVESIHLDFKLDTDKWND
jgi:hypothetical protein